MHHFLKLHHNVMHTWLYRKNEKVHL